MPSKKSKTGLSVLHNLVAIAKADGTINEWERKFLEKVADRKKISHEVLDSLIKVVNNITAPYAETIQEKMEILSDCVEIAVIDKKLHEKERRFCLQICKGLDLDENYLQELISNSTNGIIN